MICKKGTQEEKMTDKVHPLHLLPQKLYYFKKDVGCTLSVIFSSTLVCVLFCIPSLLTIAIFILVAFCW